MKNLYCSTFLALLAATTWGCAELDLEQVEPAEMTIELQEEQPSTASALPDEQEAQEEASADSTPAFETEALPGSCEGKRCGEPCGSGYACDPFGQCTKNPGCD